MQNTPKHGPAGNGRIRATGGKPAPMLSIEVEISPELAAVLDAFAASLNDTSRDEAAALAITEWARDRGFLPAGTNRTVPLGQLNSHNDG